LGPRPDRSAELARHARELSSAIERWRESRSFQLTQQWKRRLDRRRGRASADRLALLGEQVLQLATVWDAEGDSARAPVLLRSIRDAHAAAASEETLRAVRLIGEVRDLVLRRARAPGPAEEVAARIDALAMLAGLPGPATVPVSRRPMSSPPAGRRGQDEPLVDVVVPVYGALHAARRCLEAVSRSSTRTPYALVVIDDSGGDAEVARNLSSWSRELGFTLLTNARNEGWVASIQRGIDLHPDRDVVILNSDAYVSSSTLGGSWLDRLRAAAHGDWRIGAVTPWTNDGGLTSHPFAGSAAPTPDEETLRRLDEAAARAHPGFTPTLPTAVGFCTYLRRDCLDAVGPFDRERFGRGYGEENDFSMRARALGWRCVLAADVFVAHAGGASFGVEKHTLQEAARRTLDALHPRYREDVEDFALRDPLGALRRALDLELVNGAGDAILFVSQAAGGGTGRHVLDLARLWEEEGVRAYWLHPAVPALAGETGVLRLERPAGVAAPSGLFDIGNDASLSDPGEPAALADAMRRLGIGHVHFHHTLGLPECVLGLPDELGVAYDFTLHDYFSICPRVHLLGATHRYCGEPDAAACRVCVASEGSPVGRDVDVARWRARAGRLLGGARRVFVPAEDVAKRLAPYFPGVDFTLRAHPERGGVRSRAIPWLPGTTLRVAVVGALDVAKGAEVLEACIADANARALPIEFHLVGYTDRDDRLRGRARARLHGPYEEARVSALLAGLGCQRVLLPSVIPETHCYALSLALDAGLHPVAFDLGAVAERLRKLGEGTLLDVSADAGAINDALLTPIAPSTRREIAPVRYRNLRDEYYERPFA
jgi:GT2 family glycosyltransferase